MLELFSKPLEQITATDVAPLIGWPESGVVEFKEDLAFDGGPQKGRHPWHSGGKLDANAKNKLFKELVAFANTAGGTLVLGVAESTAKPPVAQAITPIPRCVDLAEALERAAQSIDPTIPLLGVQGVVTQPDGSGIVLFRVPTSRALPHRSTDNHCYIRRGTNSVPMSMREIQELTLASSRRADRVTQQFSVATDAFREWLISPILGGIVAKSPRVIGLRATAVPVGADFEVPRLFGRADRLGLRAAYEISATGGGAQFKAKAEVLYLPSQERPVVRGTRRYDPEQPLCRVEAFQNGTVSVWFRLPDYDGNPRFEVSCPIAHAVNALRAADFLRTEAGIPECEYAFEMEIRSGIIRQVMQDNMMFIPPGTPPEVSIVGWTKAVVGFSVIGRIPAPGLVLPRLSFGPMAELDSLITLLSGDIYDAASAGLPNPIQLTVTI